MSNQIKRKLSLFSWGVLLATGSLWAGLWSTQAQAQAPAQKPNILFIMGDDIGWMQPSIYHGGLMDGETPNKFSMSGAK